MPKFFKYKLIKIECGKDSCASEPGKFCPQLRTKNFGIRCFCNIFKQDSELEEKDGWLQRWDDCKFAEHAECHILRESY